MARTRSILKLTPLVLGLVLTNSCAHRPPALMVADRLWYPHRTGFIFRAGYFSAAEVSDPRWERGRVRMMQEQGITCGSSGSDIVRRDVRWYPATELSGQRCAALVYTVLCERENRLATSSAEEARREVLNREPGRPIQRNCGIKDYYFYHPEDCPAVRYRPPGCRHHMRQETGTEPTPS